MLKEGTVELGIRYKRGVAQLHTQDQLQFGDQSLNAVYGLADSHVTE
jgi:hypothetical protein